MPDCCDSDRKCPRYSASKRRLCRWYRRKWAKEAKDEG